MIKGSKKQLLDLIKSKGIITLDEAVENTGLAKTTLREHFLQLENDGYAERTFERDGPGRPSLQYELTSKGHRLYPSYEPKLAGKFIQYLKEEGEEEKIEAFFEKFWEERFLKAKNRMDRFAPDQTKERLQALVEMLEEEGFMPEFELDEQREEITIKECNCPFSEIVKETRLPCKLEALFFKKILGDEARRTSHIAEGDYSCTYQAPDKETLELDS